MYRLHDERALRNVEALGKAFPAARQFRAILWQLKSDYTWTKRMDDDRWIALVKFNEDLQAKYGITREFLAMFSRHPVFEVRDLAARDTALQLLPEGRQIEEFLQYFWSPDKRLSEKLETWNSEARSSTVTLPIQVPRDGHEASPELTIRQLHKNLTGRDWYLELQPVTGREFFGRRQLIQRIAKQLQRGTIVGIFGLRKSGKTSLVKEVGRQFSLIEPDKRLFIFHDLESLPSDSTKIQYDITSRLRESLRICFKSHGVRTKELADLDPSASPQQIQAAVRASLIDAAKRQIQVILALDEIESLIGSAETLASEERSYVPELFGAFRALVQENSNFSIILSGLTSAPIFRDELYGRENPLFSWATPFFLPSLTLEESSDLIQDLGRRAAYSWTADAVRTVWEATGGNILMMRTLCSTVTHAPNSGRFTGDLVQGSVRSWKRSNAERFRGVCGSLARHYPNEYDLLLELASGRLSLEECDDMFPVETSRLIGLDLIRETPGGNLALGPLSGFAK